MIEVWEPKLIQGLMGLAKVLHHGIYEYLVLLLEAIVDLLQL